MNDVCTLGQANFDHILVKAITGGPSACALAGLTLVSVAVWLANVIILVNRVSTPPVAAVLCIRSQRVQFSLVHEVVLKMQ